MKDDSNYHQFIFSGCNPPLTTSGVKSSTSNGITLPTVEHHYQLSRLQFHLHQEDPVSKNCSAFLIPVMP